MTETLSVCFNNASSENNNKTNSTLSVPTETQSTKKVASLFGPPGFAGLVLPDAFMLLFIGGLGVAPRCAAWLVGRVPNCGVCEVVP